jgi:hypothetical protein
LAPYLLLHAGTPVLRIASILAAVQSAGLGFTCQLGATVCPSDDSHMDPLAGVCTGIAALANPILRQQL